MRLSAPVEFGSGPQAARIGESGISGYFTAQGGANGPGVIGAGFGEEGKWALTAGLVAGARMGGGAGGKTGPEYVCRC